MRELYGNNEIEYLLGFFLKKNVAIVSLNIKCLRTKLINYIFSKYSQYTSKTFSSFFEVFKLLWDNCNNRDKISRLVISKYNRYKYSDPLFTLLPKIEDISHEILKKKIPYYRYFYSTR